MKLEILLSHPAIQAIGKALIHFIWQGSLLALVLWIFKAIVPSSAARLRYSGATLIMLSMPVVLLVTAERSLSPLEPSYKAATTQRIEHSYRHASAAPSRFVLSGSARRAPMAEIPGWVACLWMVGVVLLTIRAVGGWTGALNLRRGGIPASPRLQHLLVRVKNRLQLSAPVRLYISTVIRVPTVVGWLRPCILLPVTALTGLSEWQIAAILAHELAHVRRLDYLVNLVQTAIETALFYHPAVWWVGRQMRCEREHCCDDVAVAVCGSALRYASALSEMEQIRDDVPEPAVAATGGDLVGRIQRVLNRQESTAPPIGAIAAALLTLSITSAIAISLEAAPQESQPVFEAATIKLAPAENSDFHLYWVQGGRFISNGATLKDLVGFAYDVRGHQISGGPSWLDTTKYNIEGKAENPSSIPPGFAAAESFRTMVRSLLNDRFKLAVHRQSREEPIYRLRVAKGGEKLKEAKSLVPSGLFPARGHVEGKAASLALLARYLAGPAGRVVADETGLHDRYDFTLTYAPDLPAVALGDASNPLPAAEAVPDIFTALQEQLGLKLEPGRGPVEALVIDHAEKLAEN